ncbi:S46 family peptidase [Rubrivirga sp. S365]|uniref:Dipeptidyl-peptidase n=1 Tax=Rubrivirga litoralis TaxID=3075598 RepID=A0ABU3BS81_9BACT|nr:MULTISPECIES: S46 family peptidase [unclassified Rubrivirga]MDT0632139.1 S46 family peptidase [Rubrivirga sp. F394]MDT7857030.1 S46 family peptidase [Rubrivirga sp. S365]
MRPLATLAALLFAWTVAAPPAPAQAPTFDPDTVRAQPLDGGKMWLFEDPPTEYLAETYGFRPDEAWYRRARLASLRMPGCSASFVSPHGLVLTNHHCAQSSVVAVDEGGEGLLDAGFAATELGQERRVPDLYMDQLVAIEDVTAEMSAPVDAAQTDAEREAAFAEAEAAVTARLLADYGVTAPDEDADDYVVQVVALYDGGRYSAYTFRRYRDVRLVMAPEQALGFFGGDYDNFTYPRYAADFAFFRIYGDDGQPLESPEFFPLSQEGVEAGSVVFVIGNPGSTARGLTVAQLEFLRDVQLATTLDFVDSRAAALQAYLDSGEAPEPDQVRSQIFELSNAQKAFGGRLRGLSDPYIIARRAAAERDFREASPEAAAIIDEQTRLQEEKRDLAAAYRAFPYLYSRTYGSALLQRAQAAAEGNAEAAAVEDRPARLERAYLEAEVDALRGYYQARGEALPTPLQGASAEAVADRLLSTSAAASAAGGVADDDPAVVLVRAVAPDLAAFRSASAGFSAREGDLARRLGRARYVTYGGAVPPDATFSLRFTDGVVTGYPYNGTIAPPLTTLFGMYDRYHSFCTSGRDVARCDWALPENWLEAQGNLDLSTPVNFTSTSDTIGGNSGSPTVNRDGELVGLNFDRTIEGLVRDYLYAPERGRNVMVDTRLVQEALANVYDLDGLLAEIRSGTLRQ